MKILKLICLSLFIVLTSCEKSNDDEATVSIIQSWKLVKRKYFVFTTPYIPVDINEECTLTISSDSSVVYNDHLLNFDWEGTISYDTEEAKYFVDFEDSFYDNYFYRVNLYEDSLRVYHYYPDPSGEPAHYLDVFIPQN